MPFVGLLCRERISPIGFHYCFHLLLNRDDSGCEADLPFSLWEKWILMAGCEIGEIWRALVLYKNNFPAWAWPSEDGGIFCDSWAECILSWSPGPGPSCPLWKPHPSDKKTTALSPLSWGCLTYIFSLSCDVFSWDYSVEKIENAPGEINNSL